jgi:hypothetical protein
MRCEGYTSGGIAKISLVEVKSCDEDTCRDACPSDTMREESTIRGYRYFAEPVEPDHHAQVVRQIPGPTENLSPLAKPQGTSTEIELRDCMKCVYMPDCMASVLRLGPFELEVCEMQTGKRRLAVAGEHTARGIRQRADRQAIMDSIRRRRLFSRNNVSQDTALIPSTVSGHLAHLLHENVIRRIGRQGKNIMYELVE